MKVSICIPVYNREKLIMRAVNSALMQTYNNIEIIVVDNQSNDFTFDIVCNAAKLDGRIKCYQNNKNVGALNNFKIAIQHSTGDYVVLLGSDDWLEPDYIKNKIEIIKNYPNICYVSGMVKIYNQIDEINLDLYSIYNYKEGWLTKKYINNNFYKKFLVSYFCMFRKNLIENNFRLEYEDEYGWGVYQKGLGLDLINCLDIANTTENFTAYYVPNGAYCFCNQEERESNEIIKSYKSDNEIIKIIKDYKYNAYLLSQYIKTYDKKAAKDIIDYKSRLLAYEIIKKILQSKLYQKKVVKELIDYKIRLNIGNICIVNYILYLPFVIACKLANRLNRILKLKINKLVNRL